MGSRVSQLLVCLVTTAFVSRPVVAAGPAASLPATPGIGGGNLLSVGLSLIIVVGVIVALGWFYSRSRLVSGGGAELITIVASRALGPKERLIVVDVGGEQILIGMTSTGANTLHVLDKPLERSRTATAGSGFANRLKSALLENGQ